MTFEDRVKGVLVSAAYGDALGAVVEKLSRAQIKAQYGYVHSLQTTWYKATLGEGATLGKQRGNGIVTDDTLMTLALCRVYMTVQRHLDAYDMADEFVKEIAFRPTFVPEFQRQALIIDRLFYPEKHIFLRHTLANCEPREGGYGNMVNCGAAMYIAPIGIVNAGNPLAAYQEAILFASGHQVSYGLEAAGVLASCVAKAFEPGVTVSQIVDTALAVAKDGTKAAIEAVVTTAEQLRGRGLSYDERVTALHEAIAPFSPMGDDVHRKIEKVGVPSNHYTPSRVWSIEELPLALAFIVYHDGAYVEAIQDGINSGRDTDSIGVMIGVILGAMYGTTYIEAEDERLLSEVNQINFTDVANNFSHVARQIIERDIETAMSMKTMLSSLMEGS